MREQFTVIFDFDGTLADTLDLAFRIYNEHRGDFGSKEIDIKNLEVYQKLGYKKAMKQLGVRWTMLPKIALTVSREMKQHMDEVKPFPGVIDVLHDLKKEGISTGVLTSNNGVLVREFLEKNEFPAFDFLVSEKTLFGKEKALKKIIKRHDLNKDRVIYVGDEPRDVNACQKAGIPVIGVSWGFGGVAGLEPSKPDKIVDSSKQLYSEIMKFESSSRE